VPPVQTGGFLFPPDRIFLVIIEEGGDRIVERFDDTNVVIRVPDVGGHAVWTQLTVKAVNAANDEIRVIVADHVMVIVLQKQEGHGIIS
jgi:hypothetical protein